jgi:chromosome segregation ATPase
MTKLTWQLNDLTLHLQATQEQSQKIMQQMHELEQQLTHAGASPLIINPEFEINKLNFLTQQHEKKDELAAVLRNHQTLENKLKDKQQRVKTELKMLEKYLVREESKQKAQQQKAQENAMDEWGVCSLK